ncbi:MAG: hypothetical protein K6G10_04100 [Butyrivibrio sp.]|nr:hypothetical protein [Butyrivibrio sp.]
MKKVYKGEFGYISYRKKVGMIRTGIFLFLVLVTFIIGLISFGSQKNVLSIVAALLCLPTGWSAVNMIMFIKYSSCTEKDYEKIEKHKGDLFMQYDHIITSYEKNYKVCASTVLDKNICCYTDDKDYDLADCEKHIMKMMAQNGYGSYSIKIFDNIDKFCERLEGLEKLRAEKGIDPKTIEDAWVPGTTQTPAGVLLSISL